MASFLEELGEVPHIAAHCDASEALGVVRHSGLGKLKHIDIRELWLQSEIAEGRVSMLKEPMETNPADVLTKIMQRSERHAAVSARLGIYLTWNDVPTSSVRRAQPFKVDVEAAEKIMQVLALFSALSQAKGEDGRVDGAL